MPGDTGSVRLDSVLQQGCGLCVTFTRQSDRFAHTLALLSDKDETPLWSSLEGEAQQRWPDSPPFQQLSVEERPDGSRVALLVGMAGKSHWSASVQLAADAPRIGFDVACRVQEPVGWLGSSYCVGQPRPRCNGRTLTQRLGNDRQLVLTVQQVDGGCGRLSCRHSKLQIRCDAAATALPATLRWKYEIQIV